MGLLLNLDLSLSTKTADGPSFYLYVQQQWVISQKRLGFVIAVICPECSLNSILLYNNKTYLKLTAKYITATCTVSSQQLWQNTPEATKKPILFP